MPEVLRQAQGVPQLAELGRNALCLLAGLAQALSLAWPFEGALKGTTQGWLQCLSLLALAALIDRSQSLRQAGMRGWLYAWAWLAGSFWWLFISLHNYGGLASPLAVAVVALFTAAMALYYGAACAAFHWLCKDEARVLPKVFAFAALWVLAEIARGTWWTGFPWAAIGYAHIESPLRHWAPWIGVYGICALSAGLAMGLGARRITMRMRWSVRRTDAAAWLILTSSVLVLGYTWVRSPSRDAHFTTLSEQPLRVSLIQGNIDQALKFNASVPLALNNYREALLSSSSDLTVTPETAIPLLPEQLPHGYWATLQTRYAQSDQIALIGLPLAQRTLHGQRQYSNSAVALMPQPTPDRTATYQYDKHHLVPFGEFVPPLFRWFVRMLNIPLGDFRPGEAGQAPLHFKGERIAPNICYEDLFGEEIARGFATPASAPTLMVNLSNIAWFGDSVAIDQHLHISRMRALEMGRPMLRATNTGATAIINARGEVTHRLPAAVMGTLTAEVWGVHGAITPYARWASQWGLWPLVISALGTLICLAALRHRKAKALAAPHHFAP